MRFSANTTQHLGHYVYALVDPRDDSIFYVGKASANNRAFDHLRLDKSPAAKKKNELIGEIRRARLEPKVEILRYGLKLAKDCFEVEAAIIDVLGLEHLTNEVRGHGIDRGRQTASEVERLHGSKPVALETIHESLMFFFIKKTYSPTKNEGELYDSVRQFWYEVGLRTRTVSLIDNSLPYPVALAIVDSVVVRAYSVRAWFPAGTTYSSRGSAPAGKDWEFVGQLLTDHPLLGRRLTKSGNDLAANQKGYGYHN